MLNKTNFKLIALGVLIGAVIVAAVLWRNIFTNEQYVAVSLSNGSLMFGKLSRFPRFSLTDVFVAIQNQDGQQQLAPLNMAPWAPKNNVLYINDDLIVHWSYLDPAGQLVQQMKSGPSGQGNQLPQQPPASQLPPQSQQPKQPSLPSSSSQIQQTQPPKQPSIAR